MENEVNEIELDDGGVIESPEENTGTIRRRDCDGCLMEVRTIEDYNWSEWGDLFNVTVEDFDQEDEDYG